MKPRIRKFLARLLSLGLLLQAASPLSALAADEGESSPLVQSSTAAALSSNVYDISQSHITVTMTGSNTYTVERTGILNPTTDTNVTGPITIIGTTSSYVFDFKCAEGVTGTMQIILDNANIQTDYYDSAFNGLDASNASCALELTLKGANTLTGGVCGLYAAYSSLTITGDGSLNATGSSATGMGGIYSKELTLTNANVTANGIRCNSNMTLSGRTVNSTKGITSDSGNVTITGGNVTASNSGNAINAKTNVIINGGTVIATSTNSDSHGILSTNGVVSINGSADVTAKGGKDGISVKWGGLSVNGSTLNADGGSRAVFVGGASGVEITNSTTSFNTAGGSGQHGIYSNYKIQITGSTVEAAGSSYGIYSGTSNSNVSIADSTVKATSIHHAALKGSSKVCLTRQTSVSNINTSALNTNGTGWLICKDTSGESRCAAPVGYKLPTGFDPDALSNYAALTLEKESYTLTTGTRCSVTEVDGTAYTSGKILYGAKVTVKAQKPSDDELFDGWTVTSGTSVLSPEDIGLTKNDATFTCTFNMPAANAEITAAYKSKPTNQPVPTGVRINDGNVTILPVGLVYENGRLTASDTCTGPLKIEVTDPSLVLDVSLRSVTGNVTLLGVNDVAITGTVTGTLTVGTETTPISGGVTVSGQIKSDTKINCAGNVTLENSSGYYTTGSLTVWGADNVTARISGQYASCAIGGNATITCSGKVELTSTGLRAMGSNDLLTYTQMQGASYTVRLDNQAPFTRTGIFKESEENLLSKVKCIIITPTGSTPAPGPDDGDDTTDDTSAAISGSDSGAGGAVAAVMVGGAAVWGGYQVATRVILHKLLPEGAAIPANRGQLALLVWNAAGRPEPAAAPAFTDVADADTAKAAQWCAEQGYLDAKTESTFKPDGLVTKVKVIKAWNAAFPKN